MRAGLKSKNTVENSAADPQQLSIGPVLRPRIGHKGLLARHLQGNVGAMCLSFARRQPAISDVKAP